MNLKYIAVDIDKLINKPGVNPALEKKYEETGLIAALPDISLEQSIALITKTILGWAMIFTIIALVVAGFFYLQARGKEEDVTKAKGIILYLVIGMAVMSAAYGIVAGIAQFEFF